MDSTALRIMVEGLTVLGRPENGQHVGLFVRPNGFEGWDDGADSRRDRVDIPGSHGEFDLPGFLGPRVFSIDGWALTYSERELAHFREQVLGVGAAGGRVRVSVEHQGQLLWANARVGGKPTFRDAGIRHGLMRAQFQWQFIASDPRKYSGIDKVASGVASLNRGNFPAVPIFEVTTSVATGYRINGPDGRHFIVSTPLPVGQKDVIDFRTARVRRNGVLLAGAVSRAQTWSLPPGVQILQTLVPAAGTGVLVAHTPHTHY